MQPKPNLAAVLAVDPEADALCSASVMEPSCDMNDALARRRRRRSGRTCSEGIMARVVVRGVITHASQQCGYEAVEQASSLPADRLLCVGRRRNRETRLR